MFCEPTCVPHPRRDRQLAHLCCPVPSDALPFVRNHSDLDFPSSHRAPDLCFQTQRQAEGDARKGTEGRRAVSEPALYRCFPDAFLLHPLGSFCSSWRPIPQVKLRRVNAYCSKEPWCSLLSPSTFSLRIRPTNIHCVHCTSWGSKDTLKTRTQSPPLRSSQRRVGKCDNEDAEHGQKTSELRKRVGVRNRESQFKIWKVSRQTEASLFTFQNGPGAGSLLTAFDVGKSLTSLIYLIHIAAYPTGLLIPTSAETAKTFASSPDHLETFSNLLLCPNTEKSYFFSFRPWALGFPQGESHSVIS